MKIRYQDKQTGDWKEIEALTAEIEDPYAGVLIARPAGSIGVCARDDGFEVSVNPKGRYEENWWTVDFGHGDGEIRKMSDPGPPYSRAGVTNEHEG